MSEPITVSLAPWREAWTGPPPRERMLRANGLMHRVLEWGESSLPPIVLAHGFLDHAYSFHAVGAELARNGRRAIAFDWRGHGQTEWIGAGGYYHFVDYILDLRDLLPQITDASGYHLLGHSMGGTATAMWAGTRPAGLRSLVLCEGLGPPSVSGEALPDRIGAWLASVERVRSQPPRPMLDLDLAVARLRVTHAELDGELARFLADKGTREVEGGRAWRFDPMHRTQSPLPFRVEAFIAMLERITVPVKIVTGARGFRTEDHATRAAAIAHATEIELEDAGHMMHWHRAVELARLVLDHIQAAD